MSKPKEFWIDEHAERFPDLNDCKPKTSAFVRVVEYSAYTALMQDTLALREALDNCDKSWGDYAPNPNTKAFKVLRAAREALAAFDKKHKGGE